MKIAVIDNLCLEPDQVERIKSLGETVFIESNELTKEGLLKELSETDIVCTESAPIEGVIYDLKDKLISFPFVGVGWLDLDKLSNNNVRIANAPGCNKSAVCEWIIGMMIIMSRKLLKYINIEEIEEFDVMEPISGLARKKVTILGKGNIGSKVGVVCNALDMEVDYFRRGNNLIKLIQDADFVVNCLANNPGTKGILDGNFFSSLKKGSFFISITDTEIYDIDALIDNLDSLDRLAGAAIDPAGVGIFDAENDIYRKFVQHPKIITTPHIAFHTDTTTRIANDIMIDNVEAWVNNSPTNLVN